MPASLHLSESRRARLLVPDVRTQRVGACVDAYMALYPLAEFSPGGAPMTSAMMGRIGHLGGVLYIHQAIHQNRAYDDAIVRLLWWLVEQKTVLHSGAFLQGLMLKSVVLLCEALGDKLPGDLERAVLERLATGLADALPHGLAPTLETPGNGFHLKDEQVNNWDGLGSMGLIYLAALSEKVHGATTAQARRWLRIAGNRFARFISLQYTPEGEYGEGPGYYSYGSIATMVTLDLLENHVDAAPFSSLPSYSSMRLGGVHASALWSRQIHPRDIELGPFNFNDCASGGLESPGLLHWIASHSQDPAAQDYADRLFEIGLRNVESEAAAGKPPGDQTLEYLSWSLLFRDAGLAPRPDEKPATHVFGRFGTVISRTGYSDRDMCLILRCGQAAGAHSHCDAGTFIVDALGERIVADGGKPHDRSIPEYMTYHRRSEAHNVSLIDGQGQIRENGGNWFGGKMIEFQSSADGFTALCDLSDVYLTGQRVTRRITFMHQGWILVHDATSPPAAKLVSLIHADHRDRSATIHLAPDHAVVARPRATLHVFPLIDGTIRDGGTHFHDSDREGIRTLEVHGTDGEVAYLLAIVPDSVGSVSFVKSGARKGTLTLKGQVHDIEA